MPNMSFGLTTDQFVAQTKTVTRRNGWKKIKLNVIHNGVNKVMGFKKGEHPVVLGQFIPVSSRWEPLRRMIDEPEYGKEEVIKEGFPDWTPEQFVEFYCKHNKVKPETLVNRIEIKHVKQLELPQRVCIRCNWTGAEADCMDYKHPVGARLCPECYEVTEEV